MAHYIDGFVLPISRNCLGEYKRLVQAVATDPRIEDLISSSSSGFDARRMAYGGFQSFV